MPYKAKYIISRKVLNYNRKRGESVREWLKNLRKEKGLSQQEIAEKMEISQNYYSMIETGERQKDLDLSLAKKLGEILGLSVDFIIAEEAKTLSTEIR